MATDKQNRPKHGGRAPGIRKAVVALVSFVSSLQAASCNLIVDTTDEQCQTDLDCANKGDKFASTLCTKQKVCVSTSNCGSSNECSERLGEPSYCRPSDSVCSRVFTEDCKKVWPQNALTNDRVILVGFMAPLAGDSKGYGEPLEAGAELALHEIENNSNGLPPAPGFGQRHLAMLVCDHGASPEAVARHLTDDLKVPAIIGPAFSGVTIRVFDNVAKPAGVLVLSPSATSPAISDKTDDDDLLWRTAPSDVVQAEVLKRLVVKVEEALGLPKGTAMVAVPYKSDSAGSGLANAVIVPTPGIPDPAPPLTGANSQRIEYQDPEAPNAVVDWEKSARTVLDVAPNIVLALGTDEFALNLLPLIERDWDATMPPPWYVLPEGDRTDKLIAYASTHTDLAARVVGTAPGARRSGGYLGFANRFSGLFLHEPGNLAEFAYDAAYLLAYTIAITREQFPTGAELAQALKKVTCKTDGARRIAAEPNGFSTSFNASAREGACLDFEGVSGPLDFDNAVGEAPSDIAIWCLRQKNGKVSFEPPLESYYSVSENKLQESPDPLDFSQSGWCN